MALTRFALQLLAPHLRGARVLGLGYPDLLATPDEARGILGLDAEPSASPHPIAVKGLAGPFANTADVFARAGVVEFRCVDVAPARGVEDVVDLNEPHVLGAYDVVIDAGTIEHCANVGQALKNAANAVTARGRVLHSPPLNMLNHGFYNINPTLLFDFYHQNGWLVEHLSAFSVKGEHRFVPFAVTSTGRAPMPAADAALYFLARRDVVAPLRWPKQTKYS